MTTPNQPATGEEHREAQIAEYGRYRAAQAIYIDGVRAFNPGDAVPTSHVERKVVSADEVEDTSDGGADSARVPAEPRPTAPATTAKKG